MAIRCPKRWMKDKEEDREVKGKKKGNKNK